MLQIAICDDNKGMCTQMESMVLNICKGLATKCDIDLYYTGEDLCQKLALGLRYDLIFLDIELSELSGIKVGKIIRDEYKDDITQIAYISGKSEYAMELFQCRPIDFLTKPLKYEKIKTVIQNVMRLMTIETDVFTYKHHHKLNRVKINDIMYLSSEKRKIKVVTKNAVLEFYGILDDIYHEQLEKYNFLFIHKSYIVNYNYVMTIGSDHIIMTDSTFLSISRSKAKEVRERLSKIERWYDGE